jgi:thioredoxin reductase (NADPH)
MEGDGKISGVRLRNVHTGEETVLAVGGVFIAIGHLPRSELFAGQLPTSPDGYLEVEGRSTRTAIEGVFACGDVVDHVYRQAITAAGSGCSAAIDAERWLAEHEHS